MRKKLELGGKQFGRLLVVSEAGRSAKGECLWLCKCECGSEKKVTSSHLNLGHTTSCGCAGLDGSHRRTHGACGTSIYRLWQAMRERCEQPSSKDYPNYGGRGITVCERWHSFEMFYEDMGERPDGMTLDRKDNTLGYFAANCRWATSKEQNRNRRGNFLITHKGETKPLVVWCEELNLSYPMVWQRLRTLGLPPEEAFK